MRALADALQLDDAGRAALVDAAVPMTEAALAAARSAGDQWAITHSLVALSLQLLSRSELTAGLEALAQADEAARGLGSPFSIATVLNVPASLALISDDNDDAFQRLEEAAPLAAEVGTSWSLVYTLPDLGVVAARCGLWRLAIVLFSAGAALTAATSLDVVFRPDQQLAAASYPEAKAHLDPDAYARAWEEGRSLRADQVSGYLAMIKRRSEPA